MISVLIFGAGSIGNHLAYACRNKGWEVTVFDVNPQALKRTREEIYPQRYGKWDSNIRLVQSKKDCWIEKFDLVIIGTPPDTHLAVAMEVLKTSPSRVMLIEKPLCTPDMEKCNELVSLATQTGTKILVGYNHTLTEHTQKTNLLLEENAIGKPLYLYAAFREHWEGIFNAHPWLNGPQDSYLGYSSRGGGAGGEHSHALNIWQYFSHILGMGRITEVSAMLDIVTSDTGEYDRIFQVNVRTEYGLLGHVVQDVITKPSKKMLMLQGETGFLEWHVNWKNDADALRYGKENSPITEEIFPKTRPDDFKWEIDHIGEILDQKIIESPISLERGIETMLVIAAAHLSHRAKKTIKINYDAGYSCEAFEK
ncbi:MAG: Gfo/Idh/MocA family oxidoreductase [Bacillota bacterium]